MTIPPPAEIRRIAYLGTPELAVPPLAALVASGYEVPLVVSRADTRRGRGGGHQPSPVKAAAEALGLRVTDDLADLAEVDADLGVVVAYGRIIPASVLDHLAMVNIHFSLLPRWRGAAPVERAILAGDARTGVCLMAVEEGLDTGAVYRRDEIDIGPDETLDELRTRLVTLGVSQLVAALGEGLGKPTPQVGEPVYAEKLTADERRIDWTASAPTVHRQVRVGGAWTTFRDKRLKIHRTALASGSGEPGSFDGLRVMTGDGAVELVEVQPEGKPRQDAAAWRNGAQPTADDRLH
ncbi:MAG: methionyl-tRNA formyltransferase [Acidimicrobiales bacterium]|nr:methionyl-tRNA formyltransferase [Acidimicrobiales bacterium]